MFEVLARTKGTDLFPFDATADTGKLSLRRGFAGKHRVDRGPHVRTRYGLPAARATAVELAAIGESAIVVE